MLYKQNILNENNMVTLEAIEVTFMSLGTFKRHKMAYMVFSYSLKWRNECCFPAKSEQANVSNSHTEIELRLVSVSLMNETCKLWILSKQYTDSLFILI